MFVVDNRASPKVALVAGGWGQNIGNAFFNIGGRWVLDQIFGPEQVAYIQDQPGYRTFNRKEKGNPRNDLGILKHLALDYLVLQGPVLSTYLAPLWEETFKALMSRGTKIVFLSAAFFRYSSTEKAAVAEFLQRYRPFLISTRDAHTYNEILSMNLNIPLYNGIDSAFFVPRAFCPLVMEIDSYYVFNFDRQIEPNVAVNSAPIKPGSSFAFNGDDWHLSFPKIATYFARQGKAHAYIGHLIDRRKLPHRINGRLIIRTEHRTNPDLQFKIYKHPNGLAWDEPWTYFTVYAGTDLTLSDRVHACILTLAYGKPAMLFSPSPRAALFSRVRCDKIRSQPVTLDLDWLRSEQESQLSWLRERLVAS